MFGNMHVHSKEFRHNDIQHTRVAVFENEVLQRPFGPIRDEITEWRNHIRRSFTICML